jgi:hypothetical protein
MSDHVSPLLSALLTDKQLADEISKTTRTVDRYTKDPTNPLPNPLPFLKIGSTRYFKRETVRQWLDSLEVRKNPPRARRRKSIDNHAA